MNKVDKLMSKAQELVLLDDKMLAIPSKLRSYKVTDTVLDEEANEGLDPMKDELKTKQKVVEVNYKYQTATILNVSSNIKDLAPGDVIVYAISNPYVIEFDFIKGVIMLRRHEVVAKIDVGKN